MRTPTKALLVVGGLCLAYGVGSLNGHTEVQTVKVPIVKTRVETVTSPPTVVRATLPESCVQAIRLMEGISKSNSVVSKSTGAILDAASDVIRDSAIRDMGSMNKSMTSLRKERSILDDAVIGNTEARELVEHRLAQCQSEIESK